MMMLLIKVVLHLYFICVGCCLLWMWVLLFVVMLVDVQWSVQAACTSALQVSPERIR